MADTVETAIYRLQVEGEEKLAQLKTSLDSVTVSEEKTTDATRTTSQALQNRLARMDPLIRAQEQYRKELESAQRYADAGVGTSAQVSAQVELATRRYNDQVAAIKQLNAAKEGAKVTAFEMQNLGFQINDVVTGLLSGQRPFQVLAQQGGQIGQIFATSRASLSDFASAGVEKLTGLLTPVRLLVGGVAGLAAGALYLGNSWQEASAEVDRALTGIGARTGTTASDIANFTKQNASAAGLSVAEARTAALEFTKTGEVTIASLKGVGDAIKGYALLTGTDAADATKTFSGAISGDLLKGIQEINKAYGALDATQLEHIRTLTETGNKTQALQVFIDATSAANKRAEESVGTLSRAWQGFKNIVSNITTGPAPTSLQDQIAALQAQRDRAASSRSVGITPGGYLNTAAAFGGKSQEVAEFDKQISDLQKKLDALNAEKAKAELNKISAAAFQDVNAILPQIDAIGKLNAAIERINQAKEKGAPAAYSTEAIAVYQHQAQLQQDSLDTTVRQAQVVNQLVAQYGGVSAQTAVTLHNLEGQLAVAQQVTAAGQMQAQYAATYNQLLAQGVTSAEAQLVAAQQLAVAQAAATSAVEKQVEALKDQTDMIRAAQNGTEAQTAASIAYKNAIQSGASAESAAALSAATLANYAARAAASSDSMAQSAAQTAAEWQAAAQWEDQARARRAASGGNFGNGSSFGNFDVPAGTQYTSMTQEGVDILNFYQYLSGRQAQSPSLNLSGQVQQQISAGVDAALSYVMGQQAHGQVLAQGSLGHPYSDYGLQDIVLQQAVSESDIISQASALFDLKNSASTDNASKLANLNQELNWLQSRPASLEQQQKIVQLRQSIDQLTSSTNSLNATNQELLSPYYDQDPRTSHIGYRSQGMASTGYIDIPGTPSANDNMTLTMPVASGERVNVTNGPNRGDGGGKSLIINVVQNISVSGNTNRDQVGRTMYQSGQDLAKQLAAISR